MKHKKLAHFLDYRFGLKVFFFDRFFLSVILFCFFGFFSGCSGSLDESEKSKLIEQLNLGNFSKVINPNNSFLGKIKNTEDGSLYFIGLHLKKNKETLDSAKKFFKYATENEIFPYNQLAKDEFYLMSSNREKLKILEEIIADDNISFKKRDEAKNKRQKILLLLENFDKMCIPVSDYLANQKIDKELADFLEKFSKKSEKYVAENTKEFTKINQGRLLVFNKNYEAAWKIFRPMLHSIEDNPYIKHRNILSEIGKAALFDSDNYAEKAKLFKALLHKTEQKSFAIDFYKTEKYFYAFYAAKLLLKAKGTENIKKAVEMFKKSIEYAPSDKDFDASLWYVLDILKNTSFNLFFDELCKTAQKWKNAYNFETFVEHTCIELVKTKNVKKFIQFQKSIANTNLIEARTKNAYILTRLKNNSTLLNNEIDYLSTETIKSRYNTLYYKILANFQLKEDIYKILNFKQYKRPKNLFNQEISTQIINGLIKYKLYKNIYNSITSIYPQIRVEDASKIAFILEESGFYSESVKLMNFALKSDGATINKTYLKHLYPRPFLDPVKKYSQEFEIPEYLLYALIRSESFFKPEVISYAGAIGLTQLMKPTAKEIAKRLKIKKYDLTDPETNIKFGAYYISKMIKQNNGDYMKGLYSYNAGYTNVKRWERKFPNLESDLFLEVIPYPETMNYGREVFTAAILYSYLYYGKSYNEVIQEFFNFSNN